MRSWSRLMAGGQLAKNARLLEHTLALVGDNVEAGVIWQGWPVKAMLATKEFWASRRHQIKLGRKQQLRNLEDGRAIMPVMITSDSSAIQPLMSKVNEVMKDNAQLKHQLRQQFSFTDSIRAISALEEVVVEEEGQRPSGSPSRLRRSSRDGTAAQIEALTAKVGFLLAEVEALQEWRATFGGSQAAPASLESIELVAAGEGVEGAADDVISNESQGQWQRVQADKASPRRRPRLPPELVQVRSYSRISTDDLSVPLVEHGVELQSVAAHMPPPPPPPTHIAFTQRYSENV